MATACNEIGGSSWQSGGQTLVSWHVYRPMEKVLSYSWDEERSSSRRVQLTNSEIDSIVSKTDTTFIISSSSIDLVKTCRRNHF